MSKEAWYFVASGLRTGPISLQSLKEILVTLPDAENVLVWSVGFPDWKTVADVKELQAVTPPPSPITHLAAPMPTWRVRWWWHPVAVCFFRLRNRYGRKAMGWVTTERQTARMRRKRVSTNLS